MSGTVHHSPGNDPLGPGTTVELADGVYGYVQPQVPSGWT